MALKTFLKKEFSKEEHSSAGEMHSPYKFNDENIPAGKHFDYYLTKRRP